MVQVEEAQPRGNVPVFEEDGIPLRADAGLVVDATPTGSTDPAAPLLYKVTVKGENIDGHHCVFRGLVEVRDALGCATRSVALRPEDFILLRGPAPPSRR
jgi:hypothetical protein